MTLAFSCMTDETKNPEVPPASAPPTSGRKPWQFQPGNKLGLKGGLKGRDKEYVRKLQSFMDEVGFPMMCQIIEGKHEDFKAPKWRWAALELAAAYARGKPKQQIDLGTDGTFREWLLGNRAGEPRKQIDLGPDAERPAINVTPEPAPDRTDQPAS